MPQKTFDHLEFVDDKEREYFATAQVGENVREFLTSPVGRLLHGRMKQQFEEAKLEALRCSPDSWWGRRQLRKWQRQADIAQSFMRILADAIIDGEHAYNELKTYRS